MELQVNASSVETGLRRGNRGYLGLVLADNEYVPIPNTQPFVPPTYFHLLNIPLDPTTIQALKPKDVHIDSKCLYLEYENVGKAL